MRSPRQISSELSARRRRLAISLAQETEAVATAEPLLIHAAPPVIAPIVVSQLVVDEPDDAIVEELAVEQAKADVPIAASPHVQAAPVAERRPVAEPRPVATPRPIVAPRPVVTSVPERPAPAQPPATKARPLPLTNPAFAPWLASRPEATWLFAGDSLTHAGRRIGRGGTFDGFLTRIVRDHLNRSRDLFLNVSSPGQTLWQVAHELDQRVLRFQPDIVLLVCGPGELEDHNRTLVEFERMFQRLVRRLNEAGAAVVVNTPPAPLRHGAPVPTDRLIRLEALRGCAMESSALMVDHWEFWEQGAAADWYRSDGVYPADRGGVELARRFVEELGLRPDGAASPSPAETRQASR